MVEQIMNCSGASSKLSQPVKVHNMELWNTTIAEHMSDIFGRLLKSYQVSSPAKMTSCPLLLTSYATWKQTFSNLQAVATTGERSSDLPRSKAPIFMFFGVKELHTHTRQACVSMYVKGMVSLEPA